MPSGYRGRAAGMNGSHCGKVDLTLGVVRGIDVSQVNLTIARRTIPLNVSADQRQAWTMHLADYNIEPPFLQMQRPVVYPATDEKDVKYSSKFAGTELNAMTFKGRAERLGWHRGSVTDGGGVSFYCKTFPGAGADALLSLDGIRVAQNRAGDLVGRRGAERQHPNAAGKPF